MFVLTFTVFCFIFTVYFILFCFIFLYFTYAGCFARRSHMAEGRRERILDASEGLESAVGQSLVYLLICRRRRRCRNVIGQM